MPLFSIRQGRFAGIFLAAWVISGLFAAFAQAQSWEQPPSAAPPSVSGALGFASEPYLSGGRAENRAPATLEIPHGSFARRQADSPTSRPLGTFTNSPTVRQVTHEQPRELPRQDVVTAEGNLSNNAVVPAVPALPAVPVASNLSAALPDSAAEASGNTIHETLAEEPAPLHAAKPLPGLHEPFPNGRPGTPGEADMDETEFAGSATTSPGANSRESDSLMDVPLERTKREKSEAAPTRSKGGFLRVLSTLGSLCLVLAVFFGFVLLLKGSSGKAGQSLPKEAAEHLGRIPLTAKVQLHLLRIGNRLVLLSVTSDGATTLTELTDADEVVQVLSACRRNDGKGSSAVFRQVLNGFLPGGSGDDERARQKKSPPGLGDLYTPADESLTSLLASGLPVKSK